MTSNNCQNSQKKSQGVYQKKVSQNKLRTPGLYFWSSKRCVRGRLQAKLGLTV